MSKKHKPSNFPKSTPFIPRAEKSPETALARPTRNRTLGKGVGLGHGGNTGNFPVIREEPLTPALKAQQAAGVIEPYLRLFKMGKCFIMVGHAVPDGWHLSISRPDKYPVWDEIAHVRYKLLAPELHMAMMLPPPGEYVNVHNFCFHLHELPSDWRDLPKLSFTKAAEAIAAEPPKAE